LPRFFETLAEPAYPDKLLAILGEPRRGLNRDFGFATTLSLSNLPA
jgi:hypothetical protein